MAKFQEHHIISDKNVATENHPLLIAAGGGSILQDSKNKIMLPTDPSYHPTKLVHCGKHDQALSVNIAREMTRVYNYGVQNRWTADQIKHD